MVEAILGESHGMFSEEKSPLGKWALVTLQELGLVWDAVY
jgi:hypothetical protein